MAGFPHRPSNLPTVESGSWCKTLMKAMKADAERLAHKALDCLESSGGKRVIIGIAGVPGSGKTTLGALVAEKINDINDTTGDALAVGLPMDGFHYSRAHLANMPNAEEAIHRRGAAFTFDGPGFLSLVRTLKERQDETVLAPSFAHEIKDPVADSIPIHPQHKIVLIEGNYCALDREPWKSAAALMDNVWFVDTPSEILWPRLAKRHLAAGIVADEKEAWERASVTDEMNAKEIRENLLKVDEIIKGA